MSFVTTALASTLLANVPAPLPCDENPPEVVAALRAHYLEVERELRGHDVSGLDALRLSRRAELLGELGRYRERGEFGVNRDLPDARLPYFSDATGRRCAVAQLMHFSGEQAFVAEVAARDNHAWIVDLAGDARFQAWLENWGLTVEEAARIHGPTFPRGGTPQPPPPPPPPGSNDNGNNGSAGGTPGPDVIRVGVRQATPTRGSASTPAAAPSTGSATNPPGTPGTAGSAPAPMPTGPTRAVAHSSPATIGAAGALSNSVPTAAGLTLSLDDSWWMWWEHNKAEFLRPNRMGQWSLNATGDSEAQAWARFLAQTRSELAGSFRATLEHEDARVRAASLDALAKLGGDEAVPQLLALLDDPSPAVRHHAILGLGATGSFSALEPLLALMQDGHLAGARQRVSSSASAFAIVALGLGRRENFDAEVDQLVARRVRERGASEREALASAAMVYQRLVPNETLEALALELASDKRESPSVRCRAIEALASSLDPEVLSKLQDLLSGPRPDERRSAALALGLMCDPLALPALQTAYELENESLTRGFALISIGRRGGDDAKVFLQRTLKQGQAADRPWCALALGLLGQNDFDPAVRRSLREGLARERQRDALGAYWIALGLAQDWNGRDLLREALAGEADARQKMYAATGLALMGDPESALIVRQSLRSSHSATERVAYAFALGIHGDEQDGEALGSALDGLADGELQGMAAVSLACHGTRDALEKLTGLALDVRAPGLRRAAAIEGLSMMLGRSEPYSFAAVSRQSNYTVYSDWMHELLQVSL